MNKASGLLWIVVAGACLFVLGFMTRDFIRQESKPTYLESLSAELHLTDAQFRQVQELLEEEDRLIEELLKGEHGKEIRRGIAQIRDKISSRIAELLDTEQRRRFDGSQETRMGMPEPDK